MTLFNLDKDSDNRKNPRINQNDHVAQPMAHNTMATTYRTDSNTNYQRVIFKNAIILSYDDQNRIIKIDGFEPRLVNYPVTIEAKYGYDVYVDILEIDPPTT